MLYWKRASGVAVFAGMLVGFFSTLVLRKTLHDVLSERVPAFVLAFITIGLFSLACSKTIGGLIEQGSFDTVYWVPS